MCALPLRDRCHREEADSFVLHEQTEAGKFLGAAREEIEKVPLRHERDELAMRGEMAEVSDLKLESSDDAAYGIELLVRQFQKVFEESEFVQKLECRGMNGVATEVTEEVLVFLEHRDGDSGAREQIAKHHPGRAAADHAASCFEGSNWHIVPPMDELLRNVRYGLRTLRKNPAFSATAIVSLALGIGVNTLVFSAFESLLLRPLPIADPERVVSVETGNGISHSFPNYKEFRDNTSTFSGLLGYRISPMSLERGGSAERIWGYLATGNYFDLLGVKPALGRFFHQQDDLRAGASPYAVLSYNSWQARFGGDPGIVGKSVRINGLSYSVLGIAPRDFHGTELFYWPEIWVPMMMQAQIERGNAWLENPYTWDTWILGRLKPGVTVSQAGADLNRIAGGLAKRFPDTDLGLSIRFSRPGLMGSALRGPVRLFVGGLLLLAGLVLLTACANLGGLLLARSADRGREMAVRLSIGAGRGSIVRQLLTEALLLALAGGLAGCAMAVFLCRVLSQWHAPMDFPVQFEVTPDWRVFVFAAAVSTVTGVFFGLGRHCKCPERN